MQHSDFLESSDDFEPETAAPSVSPDDEENDAETVGGFDFGSLLKEALQHKADAVTLKINRKALKDKRPMSGEAYTNMLADIKRIELKQEWLPRAAVAMFTVQHCVSCDNYAPLFTGLFQRQRHRNMKEASRWVAATESENFGLPKEVKTTEVNVPFCHFCLEEHGFPAEQLGILFDDEAEEAVADDITANDDELLAEADDVRQMQFEFEQDQIAETMQPASMFLPRPTKAQMDAEMASLPVLEGNPDDEQDHPANTFTTEGLF